ncbi:MAG: TlpA family protein disulfide reductase [Hyphomonadaceae bacterium]|nr:TlpA family protein disulfide reductase [Hyphomonadaceae bacterium]
MREAESLGSSAYEAISQDGRLVSLEDLRGEAVLVNVWATWCAPCRQEIPFLAELHARYSANGLRVIGVSIDAAADQEKVIETAPAFGINYDIWWTRQSGLLAS